MTLTPERIREALSACDGSRREASRVIGCSTDYLRIWIRRYRDMGEDFPEPENEISRAAKFYGLIQPGQWAEWGREQELCEVLEIRHGKALVRFGGGVEQWVGKRQLAWMPSGDVIAEATRNLRASWAPEEHVKRARWAFSGDYEIPQFVP